MVAPSNPRVSVSQITTLPLAFADDVRAYAEAGLDGIGVWGLLFRIMMPSIKPLIVFVLAIRFMDAFRVFDMIYVLTSGGPGTATETVTMYTYALAFRLLEIGKASALGVLILVILAALTGLLIAVTHRRERGEF